MLANAPLSAAPLSAAPPPLAGDAKTFTGLLGTTLSKGANELPGKPQAGAVAGPAQVSPGQVSVAVP